MYSDSVERDVKSVRSFVGKSQKSGIDGKWKHDMFNTKSPRQSRVNSQRQGPRRSFTTGGGGSSDAPRNLTTSAIRGRTAQVVVKTAAPTGPSTLFISNLASTVTQEDLEELFEQYSPEIVTLHFDSNGQSLGTADLVVPVGQVAIIQKNLEGVLLDGQQIEIMEANVAKQVSVFDRIKKVGRTDNFKVSRVTIKSRVGGGGSGGRIHNRRRP